MAAWLPFSIRSGKTRPEFDGLQEGVPDHLVNSVVERVNKYYLLTTPDLHSPYCTYFERSFWLVAPHTMSRLTARR